MIIYRQLGPEHALPNKCEVIPEMIRWGDRRGRVAHAQVDLTYRLVGPGRKRPGASGKHQPAVNLAAENLSVGALSAPAFLCLSGGLMPDQRSAQKQLI
jgi:hypothetical protein